MRTLLSTTAALLLMGTVAFAQDTTATATSNSQSGAVSGSYAGGGQANVLTYIDQTSDGKSHQIVESRGTTSVNVNERQSGTVRNEFAPAVSAPAMGSGHPCGLGNSLGVSIIGGGVTGGATRVDDACLLAQMGKTTAAMAMIAARNTSACAALVASGDISPNSKCGDGKRFEGGTYAGNQSTGPVRANPNGQPMAVGTRQVAQGNVAPVLAVASSGPVCMVKPGTKRTIISSAPTQQGKMACAASLGIR